MQERWHTWASFVWVVAGVIGGVWLFFAYGLGLVAPFLLAWLLSRLIRPLVNGMTKKNDMPRGLAAGLLVILFVGVTVGLLVWGVSRGISEVGKLMEGISQSNGLWGEMFTNVQDFLASATSHIPFLQKMANNPELEAFCQQLDSLVQEGARQMLTELGQGVTNGVMGMLGKLPTLLIFSTSLLFSCYYFSADDGRLWQGFLSVLPVAWQEKAERMRQGLARATKKYVKAYLLLGGITFIERFVGLSIMGVPYAFLLSWGIAVIDFLPLLGTGVVLVPWAVVMLVTGNMRLGLGLLILFGVSSLLRQLIEPKLLSSELGLHPLLSLFAVFAGWRLFGVWGMMTAPLVALLVKALLHPKVGE